MLKFSRQLQSAEHSAGEGLARLTVVSSTGENSEKLAIELVVQEHPIHADSQNSILALLKAAEEAFSVEIVWKH